MTDNQTNNNKSGIIRPQKNVVLENDTSFEIASNQEQIVYEQKGLDYASNLPFINKRDTGGNLIINGSVQEVPVQESEQYNESLIFELNDRAYTNNSVNRAIDTQFKYFKFPPNIITTQLPVPDILSVPDIDIDIPVLEESENDLFSSLIVPDPTETEYYEFSPRLNRNLQALPNPWGIMTFNKVLNGPQQSTANKYTISQELVDSGKDLLLSFKVAVVNGFTSSQVFAIRINRLSIDYDDPRPPLFENNDVQTMRPFGQAKTVTRGRWDLLEKTIRVRNEDMNPYDTWFLEGTSGLLTFASTFTSNLSYYYAPQSYFQIQAVDPIQGN